MNSFVFLFKNRPGAESRFNTLCGLVLSALAKGFKVSLILELDAVLSSVTFQHSYEALILSKDRVSEMIEMGAEVFICSVCAASKGVSKNSDHVSGVKFVSPEMMAGIIGERDTCISL